MTSGVYLIYNQTSNKGYIGSSVNIPKRFKEHLRALRQNKHPNRHLQSAYRKYGESSFTLSILEEAPREDLADLEQIWLDTADYKTTYNIAKFTDAPTRGLYGALAPNYGRKFPLSHSLNVARGRLGKDFDAIDISDLPSNPRANKRTKTHRLISPNGLTYEVYGLSEVCKEFNLDITAMYRVTEGQRKSHKGWTAVLG